MVGVFVALRFTIQMGNTTHTLEVEAVVRSIARIFHRKLPVADRGRNKRSGRVLYRYGSCTSNDWMGERRPSAISKRADGGFADLGWTRALR